MLLLTKQPAESFWPGVDFKTTPLDPDETLVMSGTVNGSAKSSEVLVFKEDGSDATADLVVPNTIAVKDNTKLIVKIKGGTVADRTYKITFRAVTSKGNLYEQDRTIKMHD